MSRLKAVLTALFYCVVASTALRLLAVPVALCVLSVVPSATHAHHQRSVPTPSRTAGPTPMGAA